jgi:predicted ATP-grasp superfamily ATP-dependent carboligase
MRFGSKLFVAHDREELRRCVARLAAAEIDGQVVDLVPGPDSGIYQHSTYLDARGEPRGGLTARKLRQGPPLFGMARVAEIVDDPGGLAETTVELARRIRLRGIASAEFKVDSRDGRLRFLELNGRSIVYNRLLARAGLDLAWLAWSDYVVGRPEHGHPNGWPGVWINLHADLLYSTVYRDHDRPTLTDFLTPYRRPKLEAVWSASDPLPFLVQWTRTARSGALALAGRSVTHRE